MAGAARPSGEMAGHAQTTQTAPEARGVGSRPVRLGGRHAGDGSPLRAAGSLHRDLPLQRRVERAIDRGHPTGADLGVEAVAVVEARADQRAHDCAHIVADDRGVEGALLTSLRRPFAAAPSTPPMEWQRPPGRLGEWQAEHRQPRPRRMLVAWGRARRAWDGRHAGDGSPLHAPRAPLTAPARGASGRSAPTGRSRRSAPPRRGRRRACPAWSRRPGRPTRRPARASGARSARC